VEIVSLHEETFDMGPTSVVGTTIESLEERIEWIQGQEARRLDVTTTIIRRIHEKLVTGGKKFLPD